MAEVTVTRRSVGSMGALKWEIGEIPMVASTAFEVKTKLGRVIWFQLLSVDTNSGDTSGPWYINSATASNTQDDAGVVHINNSGDAFEDTGTTTYLYEAIGYG